MMMGRWSRNRLIQGIVLDSEPQGQGLAISSLLASLGSRVVLTLVKNVAFQTPSHRLSCFFQIRASSGKGRVMKS